MCDGGCECKLDSKTTPAFFGGIIVYELALIIILLAFIFFSISYTPALNTTRKTDEATETA